MCHRDVADFVHGSTESQLWKRWKNGRMIQPSPRRWKGRTDGMSGSWFPVEGSGRRRAGEPWQRSGLRNTKRICRGVAVGRSIQQIARGLEPAHRQSAGRSKRNGGSQAYRANRANRRPGSGIAPQALSFGAAAARYDRRMAQKLALQWSPQQISGWLKRGYPTHRACRFVRSDGIAAFSSRPAACSGKELSGAVASARRISHPRATTRR